MQFEEILEQPVFGLCREEKSKIMSRRLRYLTQLHKTKCAEYARILNLYNEENDAADYENLPFLPVRVFKEFNLKSVQNSEIVKTMTSSGTSGQKTSTIYLDKVTSMNQQKAMVKIVSDFTGASRMPMIIIDCPSVLKNRAKFSARGAGILGFSIFGSKKIYALNDDMTLDIEGICTFLEQHKGERILLFGFTFIIWQHFYKELIKINEQGKKIDLSNAILIHGGGWKKLQSEAISPEEFKNKFKDICNLDKIHDYYGMVEQTGCIYMQCECGYLHASVYSDVITRRTEDFSICDYGEKGIIQVVSTIPESYPGHSLLTEDEGIIVGEDDCACGRKGKYFQIVGRIKNAEIRGCSDTFSVKTADSINNSNSVVNQTSADEKENLSEKITYLVGDKQIITSMKDVNPRKPFDESVMEFCLAISKKLMDKNISMMHQDVVSLGFWLRKSSLETFKKKYVSASDSYKLGRGTIFHIAPSNVAVNFAYSLFTGLLTGNANIVRVPTKEFEQVDIICKVINNVLVDCPSMKPYICLIRYERLKEINDYLSSLCDTRIIWGGDETIFDIRKSPVGPRCNEITFANRYSLALIDANAYLKENRIQRDALDFYNDTYLSDQNACTSPKILIWLGNQNDIENAKKLFWDQLESLVDSKYFIQAVQCVDKLSTANMSAILCGDKCGLRMVKEHRNTIMRISVDNLDEALLECLGNSGYFYEYDTSDILSVRKICNDTRCQTIGMIGNRNMLLPLLETGVKGVDRIVPIGHTMDFDLLWDGYNLVECLTRKVVLV